ncbi:MAG: DNA replication/repair protein RecF [Firmicutes bacterium]|nr:DNA replication/repair protein RecF [Bacillota bacterium]
MQINRLHMENFRNYSWEEAEFDAGLNLITGKNAQGKSNLLEAIGYLSMSSSFRGCGEGEMIQWGKEYFYLQADIESQNEVFSLSAAVNKQKRRKWRIDQQVCRRLGEIIGRFHTVTFAPEDLLLIKGGPALRRRYINRQMCQLYPEYFSLLIRYNQVVKQRNQCLKQQREDLLPLWDRQFIDLAAKITARRLQLIEALGPVVENVQESLKQGEKLTLCYQSQGLSPEAENDEESIRQQLTLQLERLRKGELYRGMSLCGPHRDDLSIDVDGVSSRAYASQGQQRSAALALKLAELAVAREIRGEYPVLLLDDVLSELDGQRQKNLLRLTVGKTQTFLTATRFSFSQGRQWHVEKGKLTCPAK